MLWVLSRPVDIDPLHTPENRYPENPVYVLTAYTAFPSSTATAPVSVAVESYRAVSHKHPLGRVYLVLAAQGCAGH